MPFLPPNQQRQSTEGKYHIESTSKKWKTEKNKNVKTDMLRSVGKQSGKYVESVLKKKKRLRLEGFAERKGRFYAWNESIRG